MNQSVIRVNVLRYMLLNKADLWLLLNRSCIFLANWKLSILIGNLWW